MWKPKYFQMITSMMAGMTQNLSPRTIGQLGADRIADGRQQAVVAVIDELPDQPGGDLGQHVGQEEQGRG